MTTFVVTFDVSDKKRKQIEKELKKRFAQRAQRSVWILESPRGTAESIYGFFCNFIMPGDELLVTEAVLSNTMFNGNSTAQKAFKGAVDIRKAREEEEEFDRQIRKRLPPKD